MVEVAQDHAAGLFSGTDEVIEKITGHKPMGDTSPVHSLRRWSVTLADTIRPFSPPRISRAHLSQKVSQAHRDTFWDRWLL